MPQRTFPGPWRVEPNAAGSFVIKDANGFALAYIYARSDPALRDQFLTPAEALVIADAIANWRNQQLASELAVANLKS